MDVLGLPSKMWSWTWFMNVRYGFFGDLFRRRGRESGTGLYVWYDVFRWRTGALKTCSSLKTIR